ncbi:glycosyltransferase [Domibacillus mangrovi]|nr:glycosyltransferase [Domibacillus mangrovi]
MKVLQVFSKLDKGGAELRTIALSKELKRHNVTFDYLCLSGKKGSLDDELIKEGSKIYYVKLKSPKFFSELNNILKKHAYHAVHSHVLYASGIIQWIAKRNQVPVRISHFRSTGSGKQESYFTQKRNSLLLKLIVNQSTDILCVSKSVKKAIFKHMKQIPDHVKVMYNGFSEDSIFKGVRQKEKKVIIHVGRMILDKNHMKVLEVFKKIHDRDKEFRLVLVGQINNQIKEKLDEFISENSLNESVVFLGVRNDIPELLSSSSLMIFPSKREGLPGGVLEALINGIPVLGSDIDPIKELKQYYGKLECININETSNKWAERAMNLVNKHNKIKQSSEELTIQLRQTPFSIEKNISEIFEMYDRDNK